jgi:hypothetical protein
MKTIPDYCTDEEYDKRIKHLAYGIIFHNGHNVTYEEALEIASVDTMKEIIRSNFVWFHADRLDLVYGAMFEYERGHKQYEKVCKNCDNNNECKFNHDISQCNAKWKVEYINFFDKFDKTYICGNLFYEWGEFIGIDLYDWNKTSITEDNECEFIKECDNAVKESLMKVMDKYNVKYVFDVSHYE